MRVLVCAQRISVPCADHIPFERYLKMNSAIGESSTLLQVYMVGSLLIMCMCPALKRWEEKPYISVCILHHCKYEKME